MTTTPLDRITYDRVCDGHELRKLIADAGLDARIQLSINGARVYVDPEVAEIWERVTRRHRRIPRSGVRLAKLVERVREEMRS